MTRASISTLFATNNILFQIVRFEYMLSRRKLVKRTPKELKKWVYSLNHRVVCREAAG
jgi:hypothetical protein